MIYGSSGNSNKSVYGEFCFKRKSYVNFERCVSLANFRKYYNETGISYKGGAISISLAHEALLFLFQSSCNFEIKHLSSIFIDGSVVCLIKHKISNAETKTPLKVPHLS